MWKLTTISDTVLPFHIIVFIICMHSYSIISSKLHMDTYVWGDGDNVIYNLHEVPNECMRSQ